LLAQMKWKRGTQNDDVVDVRGRRAPAGRIAAGGVGVTILVVVVAQLLGVDISGMFSGGGGGSTPASQQSTNPEPPQGSNDPDAELVDFIRFVMKDIQDAFAIEFKAAGKEYRRAKLFVFRDVIDTACGRSSSAIGPFYCPRDSQAYIDLSFFRDLKARFGAPGDFAQAYVLAHEIGHHIQNLDGIEKAMGRFRSEKARNAASVKQELQADCYAGVWGHHAQGKKLLEIGDLEEALKAAEAIGDDRLQKQAGVDVDPETFTHGTSAQRMKWFRRGFETGKLEACDTFSASDP
jgi:predicted metalloprotease